MLYKKVKNTVSHWKTFVVSCVQCALYTLLSKMESHLTTNLSEKLCFIFSIDLNKNGNFFRLNHDGSFNGSQVILKIF